MPPQGVDNDDHDLLRRFAALRGLPPPLDASVGGSGRERKQTLSDPLEVISGRARQAEEEHEELQRIADGLSHQAGNASFRRGLAHGDDQGKYVEDDPEVSKGLPEIRPSSPGGYTVG
jgi:hypothetical protein